MTLTKEQLKHAFETVPDGCVAIMEPSTVLKEGDYFYNTRWHRAEFTVGRSLDFHQLQLAARPIQPTPPKGYYLICNPDEIVKEGDLYLSRNTGKFTVVKHGIGRTLAFEEHPFIVRPANFFDFYYDAITIFESPSQQEKETIIEPIQFSIEYL